MALTSLAEQLQKLTVPHTSLLLQKNKRPSLLFDQSEAAGIDRATLYGLGISGLEELTEINSIFNEFKDTLFDVTSMHYERAVETAEANESLNALIKKFLYLLSPYYLLKASQKCIEWLIVRFHVNDCNVDDLLCAALPYHGTRFFARLLQVFELSKGNKKWEWLHSAQKKGVPLSKLALFTRCSSDLGFLKMICEMTVDTVVVYGNESSKLSTLFAFYCTTVVGALQNMEEVSEFQFTHLLPSLMFGLSSKCADFIASTFIIIGSISAKMSFNERLHRKLVQKISKVNQISLRSSQILLLNMLYQSESLESVSVSTNSIKNLLENADWFIPSFSNFLTTGQHVNVFYIALLRDSLKTLRDDSFTNMSSLKLFVKRLLNECRLPSQDAELLIRVIINEISQHPIKWSRILVKQLEVQYPTPWDNVIPTLLKEQKSESLSKVLCLTSVTSLVDIFEKLNHPVSAIRISAIEYIANNPNAIKIKYIDSSLNQRWNDDDPKVVEKMFFLPNSVAPCTIETVEHLLLRCWSEDGDEWRSLFFILLDKLTKWKRFHSSKSTIHVLLKPFYLTAKKIESTYSLLHNTIKQYKVTDDDIITAYKQLAHEAVHLFSILHTIHERYRKAECDKIRILTLFFEHILPEHFPKLKAKKMVGLDLENDKDALKKLLDAVKVDNKVPKQIVFKCIDTFISHTPPAPLTTTWLQVGEVTECSIMLFNYLCRLSHQQEVNEIAARYVKKQFKKDVQSRLRFLCNIYVSFTNEPAAQLTALRIANESLKDSHESYTWIRTLSVDNVIVPTVLTALGSAHRDHRTVAFDIIYSVVGSFGGVADDVTYVELLRHLLRSREEITEDAEQLAIVSYRFLSEKPDVQKMLNMSARFVSRKILDGLLEQIVDEETPAYISAGMLKTLDHSNSVTVICALIPLVERILNSTERSASQEAILHAMCTKFGADNAAAFANEAIVEFVDRRLDWNESIDIQFYDAFVRAIASVFDQLSYELQSRYFDRILTMRKYGDSDAVTSVNAFVKKITLDCTLVASYVRASLEAKIGSTLWRRGVTAMEMIQGKKKLTNCEQMVPLAFEMLRLCSVVDDEMPMEYTKQVCLSCVLNCAQKLPAQSEAMFERLFDVQQIVHCIRVSRNPQTHRQALMLLAHCANYAPQQVLNNVMAIFTFMGSSVLRQDDAFSFQIIANILETIVPLLVRNERHTGISAVLRVFAHSVSDIPDHRRLPLLVQFMRVLGDGVYLDIFVSMVITYAVTTRTKCPEVLYELCVEFGARSVLHMIYKLLQYVNRIPHEKVTEIKLSECDDTDEIFNLSKHTDKELRHFKYELLNFMSSLLSGNKFISQIALEEENMDDDFRNIVEQILLYVKSVTHYSAGNARASPKYWKVMVSQAVDILNKTNALLSNDTFLAVISNLLRHEHLTVQRKSMELLNWRLQQKGEDDKGFSDPQLISLIASLFHIVNGVEAGVDDNDFEIKLNQQTALISLKLIARNCDVFQSTNMFKELLSKLTEILTKYKERDPVLACLVLCIAELTSALKVHSIEYLPKFVPPILNIFKQYEYQEITVSDVGLVSVISSLQKVIETLPNFLSPYMDSILYEIAIVTEKVDVLESTNVKNEKHSNLSHKLKSIRQKIASEVPGRVLVTAVATAFDRLRLKGHARSAKHVLGTLADGFPENGEFDSALTFFALDALNGRAAAAHIDTANASDVDALEVDVVEALVRIVLKCSESTFRPFYRAVYRWGVVEAQGINRDRIITYYRLMASLSEKLKSIFVAFASNFIRNAAELLDQNNVSKYENDLQQSYFSGDFERSAVLVDFILIALSNVFKHDTIQFLTKDRFTMLVEPLVNQIENTIGDYEERSAKVIIPCLTYFAAATTDDSLWKQFNYLVLLKTRNPNHLVRITALHTACAFATHLGENFLPYLPESIPFFGELLEDDVEQVEKATHKALQKLEKELGEPIQKYF